MKILITGINGFVGGYLCRALEEMGYEVRGLDSGSGDERVYSCDIRNPDRVSEIMNDYNPDMIYHLAAVSRVDRDRPELIYEVNTLGTMNLLRACPVGAGFIFISSSQVYGSAGGSDPIDETYPVMPVNHYGASKAAAEHIVRAFAADRGIRPVIVRPFNHTGPGQTLDFVIPKIAAAFRDNLDSLELGDIRPVRDFTDVRDVVNAYILILENFIPGETYNVAGGEGLSVAEALDILRRLTGKKIVIRQRDDLIRRNEIMTITGNAEKIMKELGWRKKISIEKTLSDMLGDLFRVRDKGDCVK